MPKKKGAPKDAFPHFLWIGLRSVRTRLSEASEQQEQVTHSRGTVSVEVGRAGVCTADFTGTIVDGGRRIIVARIRVRATVDDGRGTAAVIGSSEGTVLGTERIGASCTEVTLTVTCLLYTSDAADE